MSSKFWIVMRKEVIDNVRDRRSLRSSLLLPILYPMLLGFTFFFAGKKIKDSTKKPVNLVVAGAKYAPVLVNYLQQHNVKLTKRESGLRKLVTKGTFKVGLRIPENFVKQFRDVKPAKLYIVVDSSRRWGKRHSKRLYRLLSAYGRKVGSLRLVARGISPEVVYPFALQKVDVATPEGFSAMMLSALPMLLLVVIFMGGLYIAIDTTAGEFERGSLEPLLINPLKRWELLLGKYLATVVFSCLGLVVAIVGFGLLPVFISTEQMGFQIHLSSSVLLKIFMLCLPLTMFASALQMLLATLSKSFKEAQSKLSMFVLVPMIPGLVLMFTPLKPQLWPSFIPTLGEQILINSMIRGDAINIGFFALSMSCTALYAGLLFVFATRLYSGERLFLRQ